MKSLFESAMRHAAVRRLLGAGVVSVVVCGCAAVPAPSGGGTQAQLAGTAWQLVSYRAGAADAAELRPSRSDQYQVRFGADGRLSARVDCNQGSGTWSAVPADADSGSVTIGPLATTRMLCPAEPLGDVFLRDLDKVRSYRIVNGRLQLLASGSIYTWETARP